MSKANFASESIWTGDNLAVLRGINSGCVDLIYLDPPFNSNRTYEAPIGSKAAGASFKDAWTLDDVDVHEHGELADRNPAAYSVIEAARQAHGKGMQSYLVFMAVRLIEMRRVLKETGSCYLHCDPTASHYLKLLMDSIFSGGGGQMRNEIIWCYRGPGSPKMRQFNRKHDVIFWYSVGRTWTFNADAVRLEHHSKTRANYKKGLKGSGHADTPLRTGKVPESWWAEEKGNGLAITAKQKNQYVGYPTQKPLALLDRIIKASSNPGDMVLDLFCGCATALVAADRLGRQWAGIDLSPLAIKLVDERIAEDRGKLFAGAIALDAPPVRTDMGDLPNYRTHRHRLYGEQEGVCAGCDTHFPFRVMDVDHILPRSRGGTNHADNLQLLCSGCNRSKGSKTMAEWRAAK